MGELRTPGERPDDEFSRDQPQRAVGIASLRDFWPFLRPERSLILAVVICMVISTTATVLMTFLPLALARYWNPERYMSIAWVIGGFFGFGLISILIQYGQVCWLAQIAQGFTLRLRLACFEKIGTLPGSAMSHQSVGALAQRNTGDVMRIQDFFTQELPTLVMSILQLTGGLIGFLVVFSLERRSIDTRELQAVALIAILMLPVLWFVMRTVNRRVRDLSRQSQLENEGIITLLVEGVAGYRDLIASGRFEIASRRFNERLGELRRLAIRTSLWGGLADLAPGASFTLLIFGYYFLATRGEPGADALAEVGRMLTFAGLLGMLHMPLAMVTAVTTRFSATRPSLDAVGQLLGTPPIYDAGQNVQIAHSGIRFEHVTHTYGNPWPVLDDISFTIAPGSFTAIIGQTGSGKTTLFYTLLRLLEPERGRVLLGDSPIREVPLAQLRRYIAFIPQSPFMFTGTIRENITLGMRADGLDEGRLLRAVKLAHLTDLIEKRSDGLDSQVGAGGATLSGGERQRVALARAFMGDPEVLVCDEYTANIDNDTARHIHRAIQREFAGKTRVVITHQLYSIRGADHILVLDGGKIADEGTHDELLGRAGLYREMWEVQRLDGVDGGGSQPLRSSGHPS